jgi:hypothetical protein
MRLEDIDLIFLIKLNSAYIIFEIIMAVTMKTGIVWDITPCGSCKNRKFGGTLPLHHQGDKHQ